MGKYKINTGVKGFKGAKLAYLKPPQNLTQALKNLVNNLQQSKAYHWLDPRSYTGLRRLAHQAGLLVVTGFLVFSAISPLFDLYITHKYYSLNAQTSTLVGAVSNDLAKQISYDTSSNAYIFNKAGMQAATTTVGPDKVPLALLQAKVGGDKSKAKSLYAVVMPTDPKQGIAYYDSNTGLSFSLVPNLTEMNAKQIDNHIIYPINQNMQMVYSVKNNGLKEDIVMKQASTDSLSFSYSLRLPDTLQARMLGDGSNELGIYSADPSLFDGSSSLSDDPAKLASAQVQDQKDHLLFAIPAPVIQAAGGGQTANDASFALSEDGKTLTVTAKHLKQLHYPLSIDPTVVITSTSDFATGNNEDNNISYPSGQINGGNLTGGSVSGGWTATTSLPTATYYATSVVYNGYVYEMGGFTTSATNVVDYAPINSNGTIGSWTATTSLPAATYNATSVVYNGYIYEIGGSVSGSPSNTVDYAPINSNGTLGSWTATTVLPTTTYAATSVAYSGYVYEIGGWTGSVTSVVDYAPINANGTIGSWTSTTSLPAATQEATSVVYNGYVYEIGGLNSSSTIISTVDYAPINSNGTLGSWTATTSLPAVNSLATSVVYNGYVYEIGGSPTTSVVDYAPINANGTIGSWTSTTSLPASTYGITSVAYNGYLYTIGGNTGSVTNVVDYAKIDPAGITSLYTSTTAIPTATYVATSVAYDGYIYEIGGYSGSSSTTVEYAQVNANGTIGSWTAATSLPTGTDSATSVAYNGYIYEIGGENGNTPTGTVEYAPINTNGTIGSWTGTTSLPVGTANATSVAYNGYLYEIGGFVNGTGEVATVEYAPINTNGTIGSWTTTTSLPVGTGYATSVIYNGYLYEIGGYTSGSTNVATVEYAPINTNGTIGSWTATVSLPNTVIAGTSVAYNGYLYEIGGYYNGSSTSAVEYALINTNGTVGSWASNIALLGSTNYATSVVSNGYLYEIGGRDGSGTRQTTVEYASINNGGAGTTGSWSATTVLPTATDVATSVAYNGYLYEIGGNTAAGPLTSVVDYAPINSNGTLGSWTATTSLPTATYYATSVAYNGYLYEIGGNTGGTAINVVDYAPINANGTLGSWTATTSLPVATYVATSVAYNGYLYEIGGLNPSASTTVDYAPINSNGTLGSWTATTVLPVANAYATAIAYNGYLYEIGGNASSSTNVVDYAPINANGTLGSWTATTSLPVATYAATSVAYNGYLYEIGGYTTNVVDYAPINANGTLGSWTATTSLPTIIYYGTSVAYNGYVYEIGGANISSPTNVVDYAPLNVMSRIAHYSQQFNFGTLLGINSITYNGNLRNANGLSSINYKTAGSNGVYSAAASSSSIVPSVMTCITTGTAQYVDVNITLDDSQSAVFPDVNGSASNVTDFTVSMTSYHPAPNIRLRGGKSFQFNTQQALDTCVSPIVTGGTLTSDATYYYRTFTTGGTFTVADGLIVADVLVIAGGGGGGGSSNTAFYAGGGGAGGLLSFTGQSITAGSYTVTVGGGGAGGTYPSGTQGTNGGDSQFGALTLVKGGGGGGGGGDQYVSLLPGKAGGSGGGGNSTSGAGGSATSGQGNAGATGGGTYQVTPQSGGGGGGAGAVGGTPADNSHGGNGGAGTSAFSSWGLATSTGQNVSGTYYYAGGAGGNGNTAGGAAGNGGGGAGGISGTGGGAGTANTGGGGGATSSGGSGIVIVRYTRVQVGG